MRWGAPFQSRSMVLCRLQLVDYGEDKDTQGRSSYPTLVLPLVRHPNEETNASGPSHGTIGLNGFHAAILNSFRPSRIKHETTPALSSSIFNNTPYHDHLIPLPERLALVVACSVCSSVT